MAKHGLLLLASMSFASGFHIPVDVNQLLHFHSSVTAHHSGDNFLHHTPNLFEAYKNALVAHPLPTKMLTGGALSVAGDAFVQSQDRSKPYDTRRAVSFGIFDMCYRALQHALFPIIVAHCHGQYMSSVVDTVAPSFHGDTSAYAAIEQTLASQLGIVPFMYYPVFYILTAFLQGLTAEGAVQRAKETFIPLMTRNLAFWLPIQFIQFQWIEPSLQISWLSLAGFVWTIILSTMAGSTKGYSQENNNEAEQIKAVEKAIYSGSNEKQKNIKDVPVVAAAIEYYGASSSLSGNNSTEVASYVYAYEKALARNK